FERLDLIPQPPRPLELLLGGGPLHLFRQLLGQVVVLALQEAFDVPPGLRGPLLGLPARARRVAPVDRVLDAWPLQPTIDGDRARAQREELPCEAQRLAHGGGRVERPEVRRAVVANPSGYQQARELLVGSEAEKRVVLVVAEDDVV